MLQAVLSVSLSIKSNQVTSIICISTATRTTQHTSITGPRHAGRRAREAFVYRRTFIHEQEKTGLLRQPGGQAHRDSAGVHRAVRDGEFLYMNNKSMDVEP